MNDNEEPIYDFSALKSFLTKKGFTIGTRQAYEAIKPEDVKPEDVTNGTMEFRDDGIFVLGSDGRERQVFLYKKKYHLGYGKPPKYHLCKCSVVDDFINRGQRDEYVRANTDPVPVVDLDNGRRITMVSSLPLCKVCLDKMSNINNLNTTQFVELLKSANGDNQNEENIETNLFGYTRDWEYISKEFREKHNYTCENCGLKLEDDYDRQYMHVHHINGDKLNNNESNLKCLCLYCHSHVDKHHYKRLTSGANKYAYCTFIDRYADEGLWPIDGKDLIKIREIARKIYEGKSPIHITIENHYHGNIDNLTINGQ